MNNIRTALTVALFLTATSAFAASDTKTIDINVVNDTFVQLTGSAVNGNTKTIGIDTVKAGNPVDLGTLGVDSNIAAGAANADCNIEFTSLNNYILKHETSGTRLRSFFLTYENSVISSNADQDKDVTVSCNHAPSELKFTPNGVVPDDADIESGTYRDTITIVVTSP